MEAMSYINILKFLGAQYVDIWYNSLSEQAALYVYDEYVLTVKSRCPIGSTSWLNPPFIPITKAFVLLGLLPY